MPEEDEQKPEGQEDIKDIRAKLEAANKKANEQEQELIGFRTEKLFNDAGLSWLTPDQRIAVKALAGEGTWTPELLKEKAEVLKFQKEEKKVENQDSNTDSSLSNSLAPTDPGLSVIDRINRSTDLRAPTPNSVTDANEFLGKLRKAESPEQALALISNEGGRFGLLVDQDIE